MKTETVGNLPYVKLFAMATAAAAISACGGGSGGGGLPMLPIASVPATEPAPAAAQPAAAVDSSAACFNEADFREGTTLESEATRAGASSTAKPLRRKSVTEGREPFAGANPIAFNVGSEKMDMAQFQHSNVTKEYKDFAGGNVMLYGKSTVTRTKITPAQSTTPLSDTTFASSETYSPPLSFPIDMKPGQAVQQKISFTKTQTTNGRIDSTTSAPATGELVYIGREKLDTALGTFDTCKFSLKITVGSSSLTKTMVNEIWQAAEGPYRGQVLKGIDAKSSMLVSKMTYSPK